MSDPIRTEAAARIQASAGDAELALVNALRELSDAQRLAANFESLHERGQRDIERRIEDAVTWARARLGTGYLGELERILTGKAVQP